ncbi:hypothetical protein B2G71_12320 [Novosphingobium sp. PC22D]|uniref:hypothetical protein n=1 Tax=Novosphingobium sp. PC22D TaxID=1962403 RepID=UPI000BF088F4|nr:hypothetical protein [Novosphingobium sp. PC22D]PEQ12286.1 hypothetical protein B2G71_12320 [Novosphingobium sp. PC22D]
MTASGRSARGPAFWGGLFCVSMVLIGAARIFDAIDATTGFVAMAVVAGVCMPQAYRAATSAARRAGDSSDALQAYNKRMLAASLGYVVGLGMATLVYERVRLDTPGLALLALLPAAPTLAMIRAMARYLLDETDEYLRYRTLLSSVIGLGFVLTLGSFWGFLETFGVVPHVWAWWVVPVFGVGMGLGQCGIAARGR